MSKELNRREFIGIGTVVAAGVLAGCSSGPKKTFNVPQWLDQAPEGPEIKAGLIGCGGRGTGAAIDFLNAGPNLRIEALGDVFPDRLDKCRAQILEEKQNEVADEKCFIGFDAFEKVIDSGVDYIILATPPHFRPEHFAAAVNAKKNIFMEKPVAVDPVGARSIIASSKELNHLASVWGLERKDDIKEIMSKPTSMCLKVRLVMWLQQIVTGTRDNYGMLNQKNHGPKWRQ